MNDLKQVLAFIAGGVLIGALLGWLLCAQCNKCPETATTITAPDTCRDTTPNLPLIVTKPKLTVLKPLKPPKDTNAPLLGKTDSLNPCPVSGVVVADYVLSEAPVIYSTFKKYPDGDSMAISASSRILPITPPDDWKWTLERFKKADTIYQVIKGKRFGIGVTVGIGTGAQNIARKNYYPDAQITVGITWMP
jgi:hypothetical protein